jgi:multisubunit Na+/H+ antiporter MnhC subunit
MRIVDRFDTWVERGPFTSADLGIYRILYALSALLIAPNIAWLGQYPDFMFRPPTGPLQLLSGFPSPAALIGLEILRSVALVMLGFGLWTRFSSIASAVTLAATYGIQYCLGKVDHTILVVLVPLVLAFADWGARFSIDAYRSRRSPAPQPQWPLRLLGLLIGWGFFTAALTKILTGWLSFSSQAARGYFVLGFLTEDRTFRLAEWVAHHDIRAAWELADWLTVIFELSILLALPWWSAFRVTLAVAAVFHVGVYLVMDIDFSHAVLAYGAFVSWGSVARRVGGSRFGGSLRARQRLPATVVYPLLSALAVVVGIATWLLMVSTAGRVYGHVLIFVGAAIGLAYLAVVGRGLLGGGRSAELRPPDSHDRHSQRTHN